MDSLEPGPAASAPVAPAALRLARWLVARRGFQAGVVPEAAALAGACDLALCGMDGATFTLVAIVDRERRPHARFGLEPDQVQALGAACAHYSGVVYGARLPVAIRIIEIGPEPPEAAQVHRLRAYRRRGFFTHCAPSAWILGTRDGSIWTNAPWGGRFSDRRAIETLLRAPGDDPPTDGPAQFAPPARPWATWGLVGLLAAIFLGPEQWLRIGPSSGWLSPPVGTLEVLGALNGLDVTGRGQGWRLLTAALLHGSPAHIVFNGLALLMAGRFLEPLVGRTWFLALFVLGALGGSAMSLLVNPADQLSVGASGAIMALLAAAFALSFRLPRGAARLELQVALAQVLVPSLLPLAGAVGGLHIDYGGHLGGALTGAGLGLVLLALWPRTRPRPPGRWLAAAVVAAGLLGTGWAVRSIGADLVELADRAAAEP